MSEDVRATQRAIDLVMIISRPRRYSQSCRGESIPKAVPSGQPQYCSPATRFFLEIQGRFRSPVLRRLEPSGNSCGPLGDWMPPWVRCSRFPPTGFRNGRSCESLSRDAHWQTSDERSDLCSATGICSRMRSRRSYEYHEVTRERQIGMDYVDRLVINERLEHSIELRRWKLRRRAPLRCWTGLSRRLWPRPFGESCLRRVINTAKREGLIESGSDCSRRRLTGLNRFAYRFGPGICCQVVSHHRAVWLVRFRGILNELHAF
ncbi:MAG: hypothetical protein JWN34_4494 [Bryobacterales bacterium]|nr:hypothetical protein [Bryobacterales bacterium]